MGKLWLIARLWGFVKNNQDILRAVVTGSGASGETHRDLRELDERTRALEERVKALEQTTSRLVTGLFLVAGAALAALVLAIIRLA